MILNEDNGYWTQDLDVNNVEDLIKSVNHDDVVAVVDGIEGGIIGYFLRPHAERIINVLNKHREEVE